MKFSLVTVLSFMAATPIFTQGFALDARQDTSIDAGASGLPTDTGIAADPSGTGIAADPSGTGIAADPSGTGIAADPSGTDGAADPNGTDSVSDALPSDSDVPPVQPTDSSAIGGPAGPLTDSPAIPTPTVPSITRSVGQPGSGPHTQVSNSTSSAGSSPTNAAIGNVASYVTALGSAAVVVFFSA